MIVRTRLVPALLGLAGAGVAGRLAAGRCPCARRRRAPAPGRGGDRRPVLPAGRQRRHRRPALRRPRQLLVRLGAARRPDQAGRPRHPGPVPLRPRLRAPVRSVPSTASAPASAARATTSSGSRPPRRSPRRPVPGRREVRRRSGPESSHGESNWLANADEVVTMNEPHMAAWWFPANDHPRDKASFDIRITVPRGKDVIANGVLVGERKRHGRHTSHWRAVEPMAPYLAFFAAGDFEKRSVSCHGITNYVAVSRHRPALRPATRRSAGRPDLHDGHGVRERAGALPVLRHGRTGDQSPGDVRAGEPDPADLPRRSVGRARGWWRTSSPTSGSGTRSRSTSWRDIWLNEGFAQYLQTYYFTEVVGGRSMQDWLTGTYDAFTSEAGFWKLSIDDPGPSAALRRCRLHARLHGGAGTAAPDRRHGVLDAAADLGLAARRTATARWPTSRRWPARSAART